MKVKVLLVGLIGVLVLLGCAGMQTAPPKDPFLTASYRALNAMDVAYDTAWSGFVNLYYDGLVKEETFQEGLKLARKYYAAWKKASLYLGNYADGKVAAEGFEDLRKAAQTALEEMKKYIKEKGEIKPIL